MSAPDKTYQCFITAQNCTRLSSVNRPRLCTPDPRHPLPHPTHTLPPPQSLVWSPERFARWTLWLSHFAVVPYHQLFGLQLFESAKSRDVLSPSTRCFTATFFQLTFLELFQDNRSFASWFIWPFTWVISFRRSRKSLDWRGKKMNSAHLLLSR